MQWLNEPAEWSEDGLTVVVQSDPGTDFWRITNSGVIRDNGHFYFEKVSGDFTALVRVHPEFKSLYDQLGLMVRVGPMHWMKCGLEFVEGIKYASVVVTRDQSDWSVRDVTAGAAQLWFRVRREGGTLLVAYSEDGAQFHLLREAYLSTADDLDVGIMCASPEGDGFTARFDGFAVSSTLPGQYQE